MCAEYSQLRAVCDMGSVRAGTGDRLARPGSPDLDTEPPPPRWQHQELAGAGEMLNGTGLAYLWDSATLRWRGVNSPCGTDGPLVAGAEQLTA